MTKQEILDKFNDIDFVYNDSSKHETLSRMLDELLKEQKAVEPKHYEATRYNGELYACSDCFHELETVKPRFCSFCGKPILWEDGMRK